MKVWWLQPASVTRANISHEFSVGSTPAPWPEDESNSCKSVSFVPPLSISFPRASLLALLSGAASSPSQLEGMCAVLFIWVVYPNSPCEMMGFAPIFQMCDSKRGEEGHLQRQTMEQWDSLVQPMAGGRRVPGGHRAGMWCTLILALHLCSQALPRGSSLHPVSSVSKVLSVDKETVNLDPLCSLGQG